MDESTNIETAFDQFSAEYLQKGRSFKVGWAAILLLHGIWRTLILILREVSKLNQPRENTGPR